MRLYEHGGDIYGNDGIILDFSVNTNPLGMPESVKQAIIDHIPDYARYPDPCCRALKTSLAKQKGVKPSNILCGNGAAELIFALCACVKPRKTLVTAPTFSEYERGAALYGGEVREFMLLETDDFSLTEGILTELTPKTDILFLCNPNNPTGRLIDPDLLEKIAGTCRDNGTLLLLDECFVDFTRGESMLPQLGEYPNLLILQAFTKIYAMAGLRLGTLYCSDEELLSCISAFCPTWNVSGVAQAAGAAALSEAGWIENTRFLVETERAFMTASLGEMGVTVYPSDANFLLIKTEKPLYEPLRKRGILVRSCGNFIGLDENYTRVGLKTRNENNVLLGAVSEVLNG